MKRNDNQRTRPRAWQTGRVLAEMSQLDIVVATRRDEYGEMLIRELQRTRAKVRHLWPLPDMLPSEADVVFCDLVAGLADRIPWIPGDPKAALIVITPQAPPPDIDAMVHCAPDAVLHRPFTTHAILTSLALARSHYLYGQRLRTRIEKLDETLRSMRAVERAKAILMNTRAMREDEAYHFLRRQAMSRRMSISAVAAAIVDANEILR
ncbi:MAG: ANTAR domain-containing protein [Alphaproteobacteria bacterium]|nr:MAG: ANTAR domain-containing protein [Alphaproteobacteria bacterium]